jgi:hypothetical protein
LNIEVSVLNIGILSSKRRVLALIRKILPSNRRVLALIVAVLASNIGVLFIEKKGFGIEQGYYHRRKGFWH